MLRKISDDELELINESLKKSTRPYYFNIKIDDNYFYIPFRSHLNKTRLRQNNYIKIDNYYLDFTKTLINVPFESTESYYMPNNKYKKLLSKQKRIKFMFIKYLKRVQKDISRDRIDIHKFSTLTTNLQYKEKIKSLNIK